jgi:cupin fold WbuC family metalloprotein
MKAVQIPALPRHELDEYLRLAATSARRRYPKILHAPGDELNQVFNFIMEDSYMQPHLHPGDEKIEKIYLIQGKMAVLFFDDHGAIRAVTVLEKGGPEYVEVPAFAWHTYVMLSDCAVSYETMMGEYERKTWKEFADWAPSEDSAESRVYLKFLKDEAARRMGKAASPPFRQS